MFRIAVLVLLCSSLGVGAARAQSPSTSPRSGGFIQVAGDVVVVREQPGFGGYFCCDAGGTTAGVSATVGVVPTPRLAVMAEFALPRRVVYDLSAPRFVQENRHGDILLSGLMAFRLRTIGRVRPEVLAGGGAAFEQTRRTWRFYQFTPGAPSLGEPASLDANHTIPNVTVGFAVPIAISARASLVPRFQATFLWRGDDARVQDGLSRWLLAPGLGIRVAF